MSVFDEAYLQAVEHVEASQKSPLKLYNSQLLSCHTAIQK